ncbi:hypothetical protein GCM10010307_51880 [Streptomyces vastus]|uniref:Uncharacterized protein n=1 Tax=Streptomyces vastus TaxID=285451 RepID=A0ABN3R8D6_9ACTN
MEVVTTVDLSTPRCAVRGNRVLVGGAISFGTVVGWWLATRHGSGLMLWLGQAVVVGAGAGTVLLAAGPAGVVPAAVGLAFGAGLQILFRVLVRSVIASAGTFKGDG